MGAPATDSSDADALVGPAVALVRSWARTSERSLSRAERRERERFADLTGDPGSVAFTMSFADRVLRPRSDDVAARQLRRVVRGASPAFLSPLDRGLLRSGARPVATPTGDGDVAGPAPAAPDRRRPGGRSGGPDAGPTSVGDLPSEGFGVNVNLLGEYVLGEQRSAPPARRHRRPARAAGRRLRLGQGLRGRPASSTCGATRTTRPRHERLRTDPAGRRRRTRRRSS